MSSQLVEKARKLLREFKADAYIHGMGCLERVDTLARGLGKRALVIASDADQEWMQKILERIRQSLVSSGAHLVSDRYVPGARPNAPREDVYRIEAEILHFNPDYVVVVGSGSTIDAAKAANALATFGMTTNDLEDYFGVGKVSELVEQTGLKQRPLLAVMTAASSGAHLTKYSNVTDPIVGQKKLIVDPAVVPERALFDYDTTATAPLDLVLDGGMDGIAHSLEVYYGAQEDLELIREIALTSIEAVIVGLQRIAQDRADAEARELLGVATDLGGYAIMVGGTNGGHLTSFSLVDILSHGRACALLNPYYTVFFAPAIEHKLRDVGQLYKKHGYIEEDLNQLKGRELGMRVAEGMIAFSRAQGFPVTLAETAGFTDKYIERALAAAKNPQLEMKLKNMPVPLNATLIDEFMGPILRAAKTGDLSLIKSMS